MAKKVTLEERLAALDALTPRDFNRDDPEANGIETLWGLTRRLSKAGESERVIPALFSLLERLSRSEEIDPRIDLGTPGPVVSALEDFPGYEAYLVESVKRYPTPLTVWMINRVINATEDPGERASWLQLLEGINGHPLATPIVKEEVQSFLEYQAGNED